MIRFELDNANLLTEKLIINIQLFHEFYNVNFNETEKDQYGCDF